MPDPYENVLVIQRADDELPIGFREIAKGVTLSVSTWAVDEIYVVGHDES